MRAVLVTLAALVLLAAAFAALPVTGSPGPHKAARPPSVDRLFPLLVPVNATPTTLACDSAGVVASLDYWPDPADTTYRASFYASGGGTVYLILPLGEDDVVSVPEDGLLRPYTLEVSVEGPVAGMLHVSVVAQARRCRELRPDGWPLVIESLNIHAGH